MLLSLAAAAVLYSSYRTIQIINSGFNISHQRRDKLSPKINNVYHHPVIALDLPPNIKGLDFAGFYASDWINMSSARTSILFKFSKYLFCAVGGVLALAILIAAALTARLAVGPISIAFLGPDLREALSEQVYYAYDVKFDDLELRWSDGNGNTGVALVAVRVADYSLQDIATVPEIIVGLSPGSMIGGDMKPEAITVVAPKIRWIKTTGGAIKFDIGAKKPGDSGKILEDFLITLASAPDPEEGKKKVLPEMRIIDAEIEIGNEVENSSLRISDADILVAPHAKGVRSTFELAIETASQPVHISAEALYRTKDQRIELALKFKDLALDGLDALFPGPVPGPIMREPVSGSIQLDMDKFFSVDAAEFELNGKALSLARIIHGTA